MSGEFAKSRLTPFGAARPEFGRGRFAAALLTLASISGCAAHTISINATPVPPTQILSTAWIAPIDGQDQGELTITRYPYKKGGECDARVSVDWMPTVDLKPNEMLKLYLPVGAHSLNVAPVGTCAENMAMANVEISDKKVNKLDIKYGWDGEMNLQTGWKTPLRRTW